MASTATTAPGYNWKLQRRRQRRRTALCCRIAIIFLASAYSIVLFYLQINDSVVEVEGYQISFGGSALQSSFLEEDAVVNQPISDSDTDTVADLDAEGKRRWWWWWWWW
jgi:hypothetical protein